MCRRRLPAVTCQHEYSYSHYNYFQPKDWAVGGIDTAAQADWFRSAFLLLSVGMFYAMQCSWKLEHYCVLEGLFLEGGISNERFRRQSCNYYRSRQRDWQSDSTAVCRRGCKCCCR
ncbi:hypothetical protein KL86SPO_40580 [uncultured Sporomusa sp.]|uniref:Uncharacterized protein n=1 Tax=uncultured Sporomusa sp. TaxID=307249 RepID=A0A212LWX4_9FIRM|nr:hypothetical protein KL86SPO_40580 [uncultured Sporomusa sp.]